MHPTAMYRQGDSSGRFKPDVAFGYRCFLDHKIYAYFGKDETLYHLKDSTSS